MPTPAMQFVRQPWAGVYRTGGAATRPGDLPRVPPAGAGDSLTVSFVSGGGLFAAGSVKTILMRPRSRWLPDSISREL